MVNVNFMLKSALFLLPLSIITGPFLPDLIITLSSILFIFYAIFNKNYTYFIEKKIIFFYIFYSYLILSSILSSDFLFSLESSLPYIRFGFFCIIVKFVSDNDPIFFKKYKLFVLIPFLYVIFDAIIQTIFGYNTLLYKVNPSQITGIFDDEKVLGSYVSRILPIAFAFIIFYKKSNFKTNIFLIFLAMISFIAIILSGERVALINFFTFIFLIMLFNIYNLRKLFLTNLSVLLSIFILIIIFNSEVKKRFIDTTLKYSGIEYGRIYIFSDHHELHFYTAYKMFKDNIFFGVGPKMFRKLCNEPEYYIKANDLFNQLHSMKERSDEFFRYDTLHGCSTHPHHFYVQILSETGIFGLFLFSSFILYLLYLVFNLNKKDLNYDFKMILIFAILMNFSPLTPSGNFFNNYLSIFYFLPIALLYASLKSSNSS